MNGNLKMLALAAMAVLAAVLVAGAAPVVYDVYDDGTVWSVELTPGNPGPDDPATTYGTVSGGGGPAEITQLNWTGGPQEDQFYRSDGDLITTPIAGEITHVLLDFKVDGNYVPYVDVFFQSQDSGSTYWSFNLNSLYDPTVGEWTSYSIPFDSIGWSDVYGTSTNDFLTDLNSGISKIGVRILYDDLTQGTQTFGIQNMGYGHEIPEPGTYITLSTALMSLGFTFARRRRKEQKA